MSDEQDPSGADARALRQMIREFADEPVIELDWEKVESRLFAEADLEREPRRLSQEGHESLAATRERASQAPLEVSQAHTAERVSVLPEAATLLEASLQQEAGSGLAGSSPTGSSPRTSRTGRGGPSKARPAAAWLGGVVAVAAAAALFLWGGQRAFEAEGLHREPRAALSPVAVQTMEPVAEAKTALPLDPAMLPSAPGLPAGTVDVAALRQGDVVEASTGSLSFGRLGVLLWTLSAGGRLAVVESLQSGALVLELQTGSLRAEVELQLGGGSSRGLVIRAGLTEVAIGDDALVTVTRSSRGLYLQVDRGSAAIRKIGDEASPRRLTGPVRAALSLDGEGIEILPADGSAASVAVAPADPNGARTTTASRAQGSLSALAAKEPAVIGPQGSPASPPPAMASEASVRTSVLSCLSRARTEHEQKTNDGVTVSVHSTLNIQLAADGSVKGAMFQPPLLPELQRCAVFVFGQQFAPGTASLAIPLHLQ